MEKKAGQDNSDLQMAAMPTLEKIAEEFEMSQESPVVSGIAMTSNTNRDKQHHADAIVRTRVFHLEGGKVETLSDSGRSDVVLTETDHALLDLQQQAVAVSSSVWPYAFHDDATSWCDQLYCFQTHTYDCCLLHLPLRRSMFCFQSLF